MWNEVDQITIDQKGLRKFSFTLFAALTILGGLLFWKYGTLSLILFGVGLALLTIGIIRPNWLRGLYKVWMALAIVLGFISSHLLLAILYYFVLTPLGLVMRSFGRDPLLKRHDTTMSTYWEKKEKKDYSKKQYEKMF